MRVAQDCVANKVRLLNRAVTAIYDDALRPHGLKISQMTILVLVSLLGDAEMKDIGSTLCLEKSTLSRNVSRLQARGWVEPVAGANARSIRIRVTTAGRRVLRRARAAWEKAQAKASTLLGNASVQEIGRAAGLSSGVVHARRG